MTDIGDGYTIETEIRVDGDLVDPATVLLSITAPSGTTTNPAPTQTETGKYRHIVTADEAGRWRYKWTTTGPAGVTHGSFIVQVDPPARLDPLANVDDLADAMGRALTETEIAQASGLLRSASARVRAFCHNRAISRVDDDQVVLRPTGDRIRLPNRPVHSITSVTPIGDDGQPVTDEFTGWEWDGGDQLKITGLCPTARAYQIVYSHGHDIVPDIIVTIVAGAAARVLDTPAGTSEGATQLTVGQFSQQFQQGTGAPGRAVRLTRADKQDLIDAGFKSMSSTIQVRA